MKIELLYFDGCPSWENGLKNLEAALQEEDLSVPVELVKVIDEPSDTAPPPDMPVPAVTVTEELAKLALAIAVPPQIPVVIVPVLSKTNLVTPEAEAAKIF